MEAGSAGGGARVCRQKHVHDGHDIAADLAGGQLHIEHEPGVLSRLDYHSIEHQPRHAPQVLHVHSREHTVPSTQDAVCGQRCACDVLRHAPQEPRQAALCAQKAPRDDKTHEVDELKDAFGRFLGLLSEGRGDNAHTGVESLRVYIYIKLTRKRL